MTTKNAYNFYLALQSQTSDTKEDLCNRASLLMKVNATMQKLSQIATRQANRERK